MVIYDLKVQGNIPELSWSHPFKHFILPYKNFAWM